MNNFNRRRWLRAAGAGAIGLSAGGFTSVPANAANPAVHASGIRGIELGKEIHLASQSSPVELGASKFSIISLGACILTLGADERLKAKVKAAVTQYTHIEYWVSLAVFDKQHMFLGAATHKEAVQYIRLGVMPMMLPEIEFDFGVSKRYRDVTGLAVAISDREVPEPLGF